MELDMTKGSPAKLITKFISPIIIRHPSLLPDDAEKELGEISEELMRDMNFPVKAAVHPCSLGHDASPTFLINSSIRS